MNLLLFFGIFISLAICSINSNYTLGNNLFQNGNFMIPLNKNKDNVK